VIRPDPPVLTSNGVAVPFDDRLFVPMRDSTSLLEDPAALRAAFDRDGYLLLRGLLDAELVTELRADYFGRFDPVLLAPGTGPAEGRFSGTQPADLPDYGTEGHPAHDFVRSTRFDGFTRLPVLRRLAEVLLAGPVELVPRRIVRHFDRATGRASRAHVDYDYMDHGTDRLVTEWIPLGDCPIECGGLIYLAGSHRLPRTALHPLRRYTDRPDDPRPVSNDLARTARALGGRWCWTDYRAGDLVVHSPHTVHASLDNRSDLIRLSADIRYRRQDETLDHRWTQPWSADDGF